MVTVHTQSPLATDADFSTFKEGQIEAAERAVVSKEVRVGEEISPGKGATERAETVRDTVRKTEVDGEQMQGSPADRTNAGTTGTDSNMNADGIRRNS